MLDLTNLGRGELSHCADRL